MKTARQRLNGKEKQQFKRDGKRPYCWRRETQGKWKEQLPGKQPRRPHRKFNFTLTVGIIDTVGGFQSDDIISFFFNFFINYFIVV